MERKLKAIVIAGIIQIAILLVFQNFSQSSVSILGYRSYRLGNRTITIKPLKGTVFIDDQNEIKKRINSTESIAFIIANDSASHSHPMLIVDFLRMDSLDSFDKLLPAVENDTTLSVISKEENKDCLSIKFAIPDQREDLFLLVRFIKCYPYYMRERTFWKGSDDIPQFVNEIISSVEVHK